MASESSVKETNPKDAIGSMKAKLSVIPAGVLFDLGNAMTEGMVKYGRHNYRVMGVRSSVYYDAAMGHLMDWWEGQDIDPESNLSHVTKAIASLVVLRDAMMQDKLVDDRPPRSKVYKADFSPTTAEIIDRHKDKTPTHYTIEYESNLRTNQARGRSAPTVAQGAVGLAIEGAGLIPKRLPEPSETYQNEDRRRDLRPTESGGGSWGAAQSYSQSAPEKHFRGPFNGEEGSR